MNKNNILQSKPIIQLNCCSKNCQSIQRLLRDGLNRIVKYLQLNINLNLDIQLKRAMIISQENSVIEKAKVKKIDDYIFKYCDKIGEGKFSQVYKGINEVSSQAIAVKVIQLSLLKSQLSKKLLQNEIQILKNLSHSNIVKCIDVITSINNCYIVMQLCSDGDLERILFHKSKFQPKEIFKIVYDLLKGLIYLSQRNIIHRDLKLANIFFHEGNYKIADFGFATICNSYFKDISIGSPVYMSPEALLSQVYSPKTDVWSFGVIIYQLLHGFTPLSHCVTEQQIKQQSILPPKINPQLPKEITEFIQLCLTNYPKQRPNIKDLLNTQYIKNLFQYFGEVQIPKQLTSTIYSVSSTQVSGSINIKVLPNHMHYQQGLSLVHYCRLIYKICKAINSKVLIQWLLTISSQLQSAKIDKRNSQWQKLKQVINEYDQKYSKQYQIQKKGISLEKVILECQSIAKTNNNIKNHLSLLLKQSENLKKSLYHFYKNTQISNYLSKDR